MFKLAKKVAMEQIPPMMASDKNRVRLSKSRTVGLAKLFLKNVIVIRESCAIANERNAYL